MDNLCTLVRTSNPHVRLYLNILVVVAVQTCKMFVVNALIHIRCSIQVGYNAANNSTRLLPKKCMNNSQDVDHWPHNTGSPEWICCDVISRIIVWKDLFKPERHK